MKVTHALRTALTVATLSAPLYARAERPDVAIPGADATRTMVVAQSFGSLAESVSLEAPPGRMRPTLALSYGSLAGPNQSGKGWNFDLGSIERSFDEGVPALSGLDKYSFHFAGSQSQIAAVNATDYRAEIEAEYKRFRRVGEGWEVRDALGTIVRFGTTAATRITAPGRTEGSTWTVQWLIDQVEDRFGNTLKVEYLTDQATPYIRAIHFGGNVRANAPERSHVIFTYEPRPDTRVSTRWGIRQVAALRLSDVSMAVDTQKARRYVLGYQQSAVSATSLLRRIGMRGLDDAAELELRRYAYTTPAVGFQANTVDETVPLAFYDSDSNDLGTQLADVDGDNKSDRVRLFSGVKKVREVDHLTVRSAGFRDGRASGTFSSR